ncbi:MAG TPA: hypothetical protein VIL37_02350 [Natronosporangium sp.]
MGKRGIIAGVVALGVIAGVGYWVGNQFDNVPLPRFGPDCTVEASGQVSLDHDQMANAATVTAVGVRLGMPDQAVVVALATALQESKLRNLPHLGDGNDHDSIGLFQQRPSQGWGSPEEISQPQYAAERFYRALAQVDGWEAMRVTEAAQRVQRSAHPEAYQKWADEATVLATALLGQAPGAVACVGPDQPTADAEAALTALREAIALDWGTDLTEAGNAEPAVAADLTDDGSGPTLSVPAGDEATGWRYAHWLVAHAAQHGVTRVRFAGLEWTAADGSWSPAEAPGDAAAGQVPAELSR